MKNKLIALGFLGVGTCYLNVSMEEAQRRYKEEHPEEEGDADVLAIFEFDDEFHCYDVWEK